MLRTIVLSSFFWIACLPIGSAAGEGQANAEPTTEQLEIAQRITQAMQGDPRFPQKYDADVWIAVTRSKLKRFVPEPAAQLLLLETVLTESARHAVEPDLLMAVIEVESHFDPYALSRAGAQGIMQVMPFWKETLGRSDDNLIALDTNIRYGAAILAHYLETSDYDLVRALSRYNGTRELRYANKVVRAQRSNWRGRSSQLVDAACARYGLAAC